MTLELYLVVAGGRGQVASLSRYKVERLLGAGQPEVSTPLFLHADVRVE